MLPPSMTSDAALKLSFVLKRTSCGANASATELVTITRTPWNSAAVLVRSGRRVVVSTKGARWLTIVSHCESILWVNAYLVLNDTESPFESNTFGPVSL